MSFFREIMGGERYVPKPNDAYPEIHPYRKPDVIQSGVCKELEVRDWQSGGKGIYAHKAIRRGREVFVFDGEKFAQKQEASMWATGSNQNAIVVGREGGTTRSSYGDFVWANPDDDSPLRWLNHSCEPNIARSKFDPFQFVALCDIQPGEQLVADYSLLETDPHWNMVCQCGSEKCRKNIQSISALSPEDIADRWEEIPGVMKDYYIQKSTDPRLAASVKEHGVFKTKGNFRDILGLTK